MRADARADSSSGPTWPEESAGWPDVRRTARSFRSTAAFDQRDALLEPPELLDRGREAGARGSLRRMRKPTEEVLDRVETIEGLQRRLADAKAGKSERGTTRRQAL
jgi:hypothetical protein